MFATSGIYASSRTDEKKVTAIYLAAVKKVVAPSEMAAFNTRLKENPMGFGVNRTKFLNGIDSYSNLARSLAREVLQAIFFAPRASPAPTIKKEIASKIDYIHAMFKLEVGKALIDKDHPVGREYQWPVAGGQIRFFPLPAGQARQL